MSDTSGQEKKSMLDSLRSTMDAINKRTGRNMVQAVGTSIVLIALIVASLVFYAQIFLWLVIAFVCVALWELRIDFATIGIRIPIVALWIMTVGTFLAIYYIPVRSSHTVVAAIGCVLTAAVVSLVATIKRENHYRVERAVAKKMGALEEDFESCSHHDYRLTHVGASLLAVFYVTVLASFIVLPLTRDHPVAFEFMILFLPSLGDIGGLTFGAAFGKHKLSPRISPKKSVEGLIGSVLFAVLGAVGIGFFTYDTDTLVRHLPALLIMGVCVGIVGLFGDLCASMLKRDMGLKDMGHILAGHGGVLDRVDSILMCAPVICMFVMAFGL
ncbi:phosphatidate cytidylyltransferase [Alloscardovia macacae]|uniref:Phosphatidate cytidylyltransferase n=1 Tax=Alloscardovia macacae TaxID=1160091 RepID=A0A1Y2SYD7_9BIFI|nr:phosphatidate cytidylyltransferase [Alloscardovia macacae]OTA27550.1 phosphatidate cytidylyltransferase [Alloscardovia macacae]OTA30198.1 phosphatidate cytidylyltransferase [Alloscardovia macacae]OZG54431.1 CDP-diglyceride synthetase [Alloscardovia macacae]